MSLILTSAFFGSCHFSGTHTHSFTFFLISLLKGAFFNNPAGKSPRPRETPAQVYQNHEGRMNLLGFLKYFFFITVSARSNETTDLFHFPTALTET